MKTQDERGIPMMFLKHVFLAVLSFSCGAAISAGTFAFLLVIGVVPRILGRTKTANRIFRAENSIIFGVLTGAVFSVFEWSALFPIPWMSHVLFTVYGLSAGIFVGCIAVALAEILNTFPIVFRRLYLNRGLPWVMVAMAFGKMVGSFLYFCAGYGYGPGH